MVEGSPGRWLRRLDFVAGYHVFNHLQSSTILVWFVGRTIDLIYLRNTALEATHRSYRWRSPPTCGTGHPIPDSTQPSLWWWAGLNVPSGRDKSVRYPLRR